MSNVQERLRAISRLQQPGMRVIVDHKEVKPLAQPVLDPFDEYGPAMATRTRGQQTEAGRLRLREAALARRRDPEWEAKRLAAFRATMASKRAAKNA